MSISTTPKYELSRPVDAQIDKRQMAKRFTTLSRELGMRVKVVDHGLVLDANRVVLSPDFTKEIKRYIEAPTITFSPDADRLAIKNFGQLLSSRKNSPGLLEYYGSNRLRFNNLYDLSFLPNTYRGLLRANPLLMNKLASALTHIPESAKEYDSLSLSEKVKLTKTLAKKLAHLFT